MRNNFLKSMAIGLSLSLVMTGCNNDGDSDLVTDQTLGQCMTYTVNSSNLAQNFNRLSFSAKYNYTTSTVDISVSGLILPASGNGSGISLPIFNFKELPWHYNKYGWKVVDVNDVTPEIKGFADKPVFNKFNFCLIDFFDEEDYRPGINYMFEIDGKYKSNGCCLTGNTVSVNPEGVEYSPEADGQTAVKPVYWIDFDFETSKADIYLYGAKFLAGMPSLNLVFPGVDMSSAQGVISLTSESLTPEYNGIPNPGFPVSQLKGSFEYEAGLTLEFNCNFRGADYKVSVNAKY